MGLVSPLHAVQQPVKAAGAIVARLDGVLRSIERLAVSLEAIEGHMVGMRADIAQLNEGVEALRGDVHDLGGVVDGIRAATIGLDAKVDQMEGSLEHIDLIARSVP